MNCAPEEAGKGDHSPTDDPLWQALDYEGSLADFNMHQYLLQFNRLEVWFLYATHSTVRPE